MAAAVADPSERVRVTVLKALHGTTALDEFLGQVRAGLFFPVSKMASSTALARVTCRRPCAGNPHPFPIDTCISL